MTLPIKDDNLFLHLLTSKLERFFVTANEIKKIRDFLTPGSKVVLVSHANPDGDAIGSVLALYGVFKKKNVNVQALLPDIVPAFYNWLKDSDEIILAEEDLAKSEALINDADIIFCLDFNAFKRVGDIEQPLRNASSIKVLVDHHPEPESGFDFVMSDTSVSSTSELIYHLIDQIEGDQIIDKPIADAIYTGIMTDTGSFNFSSAHPGMYDILKKLVEKGVNPAVVHQKVYDTFTESRTRLIGHSLLNKMIVLPEYQTAYIALSQKDLQDFNYEKGDTEGLVNYPLAIKDVVFAAFFTEKDDMVKISFRSKGSFPANQFAEKYFRGGGHLNAAGGKSYKSLKKTIENFESIIKKDFNPKLISSNDS